MTDSPRPYRDADDLYAMQRMNADAVQQVGDTGYLHVGDIPHRLFNGNRWQPPSEVAFLWEDEAGDLIAWAMIFREDHAFDLQIHPANREPAFEQQVARWISRRTAEYAQSDQPLSETVNADVFDRDTARDQALRAIGYRLLDPLYAYTERHMKDLPLMPALPDGYTLRSAVGLVDADALAEIHSASFDSEWLPGAYRHLMQTPGYLAEQEHVIVAPNGGFAAFCIGWLDHTNGVGLFEPVGTHRDHRRMGLSRALMTWTLHHMRDQGMSRAILWHELDDPAAAALYAAMGFRTKYTVMDYALPLETALSLT